MNTAVYPTRTQISLSPELKRLIEARGATVAESLSEYLRKAAMVRMALEDVARADLKLIAEVIVGRVTKSKSGWAKVKDVARWQRGERQNEDRHRA